MAMVAAVVVKPTSQSLPQPLTSPLSLVFRPACLNIRRSSFVYLEHWRSTCRGGERRTDEFEDSVSTYALLQRMPYYREFEAVVHGIEDFFK